MQVALKALQRHGSSSSNTENAGSKAEVEWLTGALQQARMEYQKLLLQHSNLQSSQVSSKEKATSMVELQAANKLLTIHLAKSQEQVQHLQQQVQEQLNWHTVETDKLQLLIEKLSGAVSEMHGMVDKAESTRQQADTACTKHNLQAVHDAVHTKLSRYESSSSESEFSPTDVLLPVLWKPQRERHLAPTGFR